MCDCAVSTGVMRDSGCIQPVNSAVQSVAFRGTLAAFMVVVAQLVEHQFVVLRVAGSSPVGHPNQQ